MVEVHNNFTVELIDSDGFTNQARVEVSTSACSSIRDYQELTHKRVEIILKEDDYHRDTTTIALSPVKAVALVRRLVQVLDGLAESGVELPLLHSRFTRHYLDHLYGAELDAEFSEQLRMFEDSAVVKDGETLWDILPVSITK